MLTLVLAGAAQEPLPERPRPRGALPDFPFPPLGHLLDLADWSSMLSDAAAPAFALVAVVWASSRWFGVAAAAWAVVVTCLPRLYFGYHCLSDSAVGALLGAPCATAAMRTPSPESSARAPVALLLGFFALGTKCLYMFEAARKVAATRASSPARSPRTRAEEPERIRRWPSWRMAMTRSVRRAGQDCVGCVSGLKGP